MRRYQSRFDLISAIASVVCLVHCLALPLFFSTLLLWDVELLENQWIEIVIVLVSILFGGLAIYQGYVTVHRLLLIPLLFAVGLGLMLAGGFAEGEAQEATLKLTGGAGVIAAHVFNWVQSRRRALKRN